MILKSDKLVEHPEVSVIILTYNHEQFIHESIESILCQKTSFKFEIIIGEDKSSDRTRAICIEYQKRYPEKIQLILHKVNRGLINNYKATLGLCRGNYIALCAGDDYWIDKHKLEKHVYVMGKNSNIVVTYHDVKTINEKGELLSAHFLRPEHKKDFSQEELNFGTLIAPLSMCFRKEAVPEIISSLNKKVFLEDFFTTSILGEYGSGMLIKSSAAYRLSPNSLFSMQRETLKKLMQIGTYAELFLYYKKRNNENVFNHFLDLFKSGLADSLNFKLNIKEVKLFRTLIWRYMKYIPFRDFLYYNKYLLTNYSFESVKFSCFAK
jgi:glycosyltransferase involved in cell wall biosynthesis